MRLGEFQGFVFRLANAVTLDEILVGVFYFFNRIHDAHGTLGYIRNIIPAQLAQNFGFQGGDIDCFTLDHIVDFAPNMPERWFKRTIQGFQQRGLATAALTGDAIDLVLAYLQIDIVDGLDHFLRAVNIQDVKGFQIFGFQNPKDL